MKSVFKFIKSYKLLSLVLVAFIASLILYFSGQKHIANWVLGVTTLIAVLPLIWDMITDLRSGHYGIDILAATAMITSVILGQFWAGIIIALMLTGGEGLENYAENRAKIELTSLLKNRPIKAHLVKPKEIIDIEVKELKVGDKVQVLPGEVIPVDGIIFEGATSLNEASITGESLPIEKNVNDEVLSGSVNIDGLITIKVIRTSENSQYEQIIKLVKAASSTESPFVRLADKYAVPFTILAFFIAGSVWFVSGEAIRFLEVIVVATPCPLLLAAPIALISGMSRSAKHGIIVKNGATLEKLGSTKTFAFDKTGTLTAGKPIVSDLQIFKPFKKEDVLKFGAGIELSSNHILAKAIVDYSVEAKVKVKSAKQVKEFAGRGLVGRIQGREILIGRWDLLLENNIEIPDKYNGQKLQNTTTFIAIDGKLAGAYSFKDDIRPETPSMLKRLGNAGIKDIIMVSGDNASAANYIAKKLEINHVVSSALPADKMLVIDQIDIKNRPVSFVGDGINDAPVLTLSDVGIALGAKGSTAASEAADVVIMLDNVGKVASAFEIAKRTFFIAKQSIIIGILLSLGLMVIFATGKFKPVYGAILQEVVDIFVIFNALRAHGAWNRLLDRKAEESL